MAAFPTEVAGFLKVGEQRPARRKPLSTFVSDHPAGLIQSAHGSRQTRAKM
jgi:hypothetical protein